AKAKNIQVIPGLEMFVQQGARQFEIWTGKPAPVAEMGFVVSKALERMAASLEEEEAAPANGSAKKTSKAEANPEIPKASKPAGKKKAKPAPAKPAKKAAKKAKKR
ncbi:MAG TPA: shikimate dehydrogenase, partial [Candidatus Angelobacter sp.]|nr:shikimate dehydrogenase [Candidatus Angelobacter sp.]